MSAMAEKYGPEVQRVSAKTPTEDIIYLLKRDGGVFIKGLIPEPDVDQAYEECRERLDNDVEWCGSFFPKETQRAPALLALSPTYARTQMMNPVYQKVCEHFLTTRNWFWWGNERKESVSKPYVHSCTAMRIGPGGKAQPLHRDDYISHNFHREIEEWDDERDKTRESAVGLFVAGTKVTKENGGTQFIPRSHLWATDRKVPPRVEDCIYAEMDKEENQYLSVPQEIAKTYDRPVQEFMGYAMSDPACGYVDQLDPIFVLRPELKGDGRPKDF
ncbi:phytanoyl dioxygenase family protein [Colletotrichum plurivorum]|uniref:Phytanoyl dioxygenase family protein n=1 Tax=Colletotrichum plurivorum TaxID=2175906 RepID=A0A8H6N6Y9_9PEZI|nr:phytanoyl dioxygenase family protein [Colletotrichum plurivorum]